MSEQVPFDNGYPIKVYGTDEQPIRLHAQLDVMDFSSPETDIPLGGVDAELTGTLGAEATLVRKDNKFGLYAHIYLSNDKTPEECIQTLLKQFGGDAKDIDSQLGILVSKSGKNSRCIMMAHSDQEDVTTVVLVAAPLESESSKEQGHLRFQFDPEDVEAICDTADEFTYFLNDAVNTLHIASSSRRLEAPVLLTLPTLAEPYIKGQTEFTIMPQVPLQIESAKPSLELQKQSEYLEGHELLPSFEDLAGLDEVIVKLQDVISDYKHPDSKEFMEEYGVNPTQTLLLQGPGGVGKTSVVRAFAKELRADLTEIKPTDVIDSYVGNSAKNLRQVFDTAKNQTEKNERPTVLFFDEFDGLFTKDAGGNPGVATQLVDELKIILNDLSTKYPDVIVFFATNELVGFNEQLLRAGRIDEKIIFTMPNEDARTKIFSLLLEKYSHLYHYSPVRATSEAITGTVLNVTVETEMQDFDIELNQLLHSDENYLTTRIDPNELAKITDGFSSADISKVLERARQVQMRSHRKTGIAPARVSANELKRLITEHRHDMPNMD